MDHEMKKQEQSIIGFILYVNKYINAIYTLIHGTPLPRIILEIRKMLQLRKDDRIGDLYLAKYHTIIRVYGFEK
jgi:hypothetical protein